MEGNDFCPRSHTEFGAELGDSSLGLFFHTLWEILPSFIAVGYRSPGRNCFELFLDLIFQSLSQRSWRSRKGVTFLMTMTLERFIPHSKVFKSPQR